MTHSKLMRADQVRIKTVICPNHLIGVKKIQNVLANLLLKSIDLVQAAMFTLHSQQLKIVSVKQIKERNKLNSLLKS